jgi:hypothetical protein
MLLSRASWTISTYHAATKPGTAKKEKAGEDISDWCGKKSITLHSLA